MIFLRSCSLPAVLFPTNSGPVPGSRIVCRVFLGGGELGISFVYPNYCLGYLYRMQATHLLRECSPPQGRKLPDCFFPLDEPEKEDDQTGENGNEAHTQ